MKVKTSITLSEDVLSQIDSLIEEDGSRSSFIEDALRGYLRRRYQLSRDERDLEILNQRADELNEEALDVLAYQVEL